MQFKKLLLFAVILLNVAYASPVHLFMPFANSNILYTTGNSYTLNQDLVCVNVTEQAGASLNLDGYQIYCIGNVILQGSITTGTDAFSAGSGGSAGGQSGYGGFIQGNYINIVGSSWITSGGNGAAAAGYMGGGGGAGAGSLIFSYGAGGFNSLGATFAQAGGTGGNGGIGCPDCSNSGASGGTTNATGGSGGSPGSNGQSGSVASIPSLTSTLIETMYNNIMQDFIEGGGGGGGGSGGYGTDSASAGKSFINSVGGSGGGGGGASTGGGGKGGTGGTGWELTYNYNINGNPFVFSNSQTQVIATNTPCTNNWYGGACYGNVIYTSSIELSNNVTITGDITISSGITSNTFSFISDNQITGTGSISTGNGAVGGAGGSHECQCNGQPGQSFPSSYGGAGGAGGSDITGPSGGAGGTTTGGTPLLNNQQLLKWWDGIGIEAITTGGGGGGGADDNFNPNGGNGGNGAYGTYLDAYSLNLSSLTMTAKGGSGTVGSSGGGGGGGGYFIFSSNNIFNSLPGMDYSGGTGGNSNGYYGYGLNGNGGTAGGARNWIWTAPPLWVLGYGITENGLETNFNTTTIFGQTSPTDKVSLFINNIYIANALSSITRNINLSDYQRADILPGNNILTIEDDTWNVSTTEIITMTSIPLVSAYLVASNPVIDSGQLETLTSSWTEGQEPFTANYMNITGQLQSSDSGIIGYTDSNSFTAYSLTSNYIVTFNAIITDANSISANSTQVKIKVNTALNVPQLYESNAVAVDVGDYETFTASASGGTTPYAYNFLVYNAVSNTLLTSYQTTSNTFTWNTNGYAGNLIHAEVLVTDNATLHESQASAFTSNVQINPTLVSTFWSVLNPIIDVGQTQMLTANIFGGTQPYTYIFSLFHSGIFNTQTNANSLPSNTYTFIEPSTTGSITANIAISDNAPAIETTGNTLSYITNNAFVTPTISLILPQQYDYGQLITFNGGEIGGTMAYTYNYITNSITNQQLANAFYTGVYSDANSFTWTFPQADIGNTVSTTLTVTDSATTHASGSTTSAFIQLNEPLVFSGIFATPTILYTNQAVNITAVLESNGQGSSPYTYNFIVYDLSNNSIVGGTVQYNIPTSKSSFIWLIPSNYAGMIVGLTATVTDSATPPETVNSTLLEFPSPIRVPPVVKKTTTPITTNTIKNVTPTISPTTSNNSETAVFAVLAIIVIIALIILYLRKQKVVPVFIPTQEG